MVKHPKLNITIIRSLLKHKAKVFTRTPEGYSALSLACDFDDERKWNQECKLKILSILIEYGENSEEDSNYNEYYKLLNLILLQKPLIKNAKEIKKFLKQLRSPDVDFQHLVTIESPIYFCIKRNWTAAAAALLEKKADPNQNNSILLYLAVKYCKLEMVKILLANKAKVNAILCRRTGSTALHIACGDLMHKKLFVKKIYKTYEKYQELVKKERISLVMILLENDANTDILDLTGSSPKAIAQKCGHDDLVKLLSS